MTLGILGVNLLGNLLTGKLELKLEQVKATIRQNYCRPTL